VENNPNLRHLNCSAVEGAHREVLSQWYDDNCLPRTRSYLAELNAGAEADREVKVFLLGNGGVGKTQLCRRLRDEPYDDKIPSTHGVQLRRQPLELATEGEGATYQINWWDFGGQDVYHGTHALFLRTRAVFLILWTPQLENQDEIEENGILMRNQPLAYWLDYVRSLAGHNCPVILVQSQCEKYNDEVKLPIQPEGLAFTRNCAFGAANDHGKGALLSRLREAIGYLQESSGELQIGRGRAEVRRRLLDWRLEDQGLPEKEARLHRTVSTKEFEVLCEEVGDIASPEHALHHFHHTGVVFHDPNLFAGQIILDQTWALDAVYAVFDRDKALPMLQEYGAFFRQVLAALVWQEHSEEEQRLFLSLMESCGICFPYRETVAGEPVYLAPDLLPAFEKVQGRLTAWKENAETVTLRLDYRFLHQGVLRKVMSRVGSEVGDAAEYWKYGFWLYDRRTDSHLRVGAEQAVGPESGEEDLEHGGAGSIVLQAQGRMPEALLRQGRDWLRLDSFSEEPSEILTLSGVTVDLAALKTRAEGRVLATDGTWVEAAAFEAFVRGSRFRETLEEPVDELRVLPDGALLAQGSIEVDAGPAPEKDDRPEVFISYAWGDGTSEGKLRDQVTNELSAALEADGFRVVRDRDELVPGLRISRFMDRLSGGDRVVCVVSDKYLHSPYCMREIYEIYRRSRGDADRFAKVVIPMILPEVEIASLPQRKPYLKHWADRHRELQEILRDPDLSFSPESYREAHYVRDFAQNVDDILIYLQDILMPRNLDAHLDDGFAAIRGALRRRLEVGESS